MTTVVPARWLPLLLLVVGAASQWLTGVTSGVVRASVAVMVGVVACYSWDLVAVLFVGSIIGRVVLLNSVGLVGLSRPGFVEVAIEALLIGLVFRRSLAQVANPSGRHFVELLGTVLVVAGLGAGVRTIMLEPISDDTPLALAVIDSALPVVVAATLAGAWVFRRRASRPRAHGLLAAFLIAAAFGSANFGMINYWTSQESATLANANQTFSWAVQQVLKSDSSLLNAQVAAPPANAWRTADDFSESVRAMVLGADSITGAALVQSQGEAFQVRYVLNTEMEALPATAKSAGLVPSDGALLASSLSAGLPNFLGIRLVAEPADPAEPALIISAPIPSATGLPDSSLVVPMSLNQLLRSAEPTMGDLRSTLILSLSDESSTASVPGAVLAADSVTGKLIPLDSRMSVSTLDIGNVKLGVRVQPAPGFGTNLGARLFWLGLIGLLGIGSLVLYFRSRASSDAVEESESRYRLLAENSADVVIEYESADDIISWVSPAISSLLGWTPEQLVGTSIVDLIHADDLDRHAVGLASDSTMHAEPMACEIRFATADGKWHWMSSLVKDSRDASGQMAGRVESLRDISATVDSRLALEQSESLFRTSMESAAIGMAIVRPDGTFLVVNQSLCTMLGYDESQLMLIGVRELVHEDSAEQVDEITSMLEGDPHSSVVEHLRLLRADGVLLWVRTAVVRVRSAPSDSADVFLLQVEDVTVEREARDLLAFRAFHDPLTGLRNRAWILDSLHVDLEAAGRQDTLVGVLFLDLDQFKVVNDSLGHAAGDEVLVSVSKRISSALRSIDRVGRFGGDEFVIVFPEVEGPRQLERAAERISEAISADLMIQGHRIVPTASIGIALSTRASTADSLLRDADSALYRAKNAGRARWQFFDEGMHSQAVARLTIEGELRDAVSRNEFVVHYQKIVALNDLRTVGYEALVRWNHPLRGLLLPEQFLSVAEASGLVSEIGPVVLDSVCALLAQHPDLPGTIAINVSAVELAQANWGERFSRIVDRHGVDPTRLIIEVTETSVLEMLATTRRDLRMLTDRGIGLHLDDFGTGFSSISVLRDLPVTGVKLDRRFVEDLTKDAGAANALAFGLAGLVSGLNLVGIAEGVDTREHAQTLRDQGWECGQGYFFGVPGPLAEDFAESMGEPSDWPLTRA